MRRWLSHPDWELRTGHWVLVNGSMVLTAYFGWTLAGGVIWLGVVLALIFAMISRLVGLCFIKAGEYRHRPVDFIRWAFLGVLFAGANIITDYGSSASIRDALTVKTQNANTLARDARTEVNRIEKRIAEIRAQTAWKTTYLAPAAYDGLIRAAELIRDNEAKRGGCGRICEQKTKELEDLNANKANAEQRLALKAEMVQLERELVEAKAKSADTPVESSAAMAQVKSLVSWVTLFIFGNTTGEQGDVAMFWGNNSIMLVTCVLTTLGIIYLSFEIGSGVIGREQMPAPAPQARYLPAEPVSLNAEDAHQAQAARDRRMDEYRRTTTVEERREHNRSKFEENMRDWALMIQEAEAMERKAGELRGAA